MQGARSSPSAPDCQISRKLVRETKKQDWVVYAKKPFGAAQQIVNYLGRYTHRVAISSARLLSISEDRIVFRTRGEKTCSVTPEEFIRRFLLHVLPHQFFKIRHYGLLAPGNVNTRLCRAQQLLGPVRENTAGQTIEGDDLTESAPAPSRASHDGATTDRARPKCPHCGGPLLRLPEPAISSCGLPPPHT
jgi:hypothetical protein